MRGTLALLAAPGIVANQRDMMQTPGFVPDDHAAVCGVRQTIEVGDPLRTQMHQRQGHLAFVQRRRGENRADGYVAIRRIDVELVRRSRFP